MQGTRLARTSTIATSLWIVSIYLLTASPLLADDETEGGSEQSLSMSINDDGQSDSMEREEETKDEPAFYLGLKAGLLPYVKYDESDVKDNFADMSGGSFQIFGEYTTLPWLGIGLNFDFQILNPEGLHERKMQMNVGPGLRFLIPARYTGDIVELYLRIAAGMTLGADPYSDDELEEDPALEEDDIEEDSASTSDESHTGAHLGTYIGAMFRIGEMGIILEPGWQTTKGGASAEAEYANNIILINIGIAGIF